VCDHGTIYTQSGRKTQRDARDISRIMDRVPISRLDLNNR